MSETTTMDPEATTGPAPAPRRVAVLGAGPIGLDAALACVERGWPVTVYEAGPQVGANVRAWGHVRLFTPWDLSASARMRSYLESAGTIVPTGSACPTGAEFADELLDPVAALPELAGRIELGTAVVAVGRQGLLKHEEIATDARAERPFRLLLRSADGAESVARADLVLDCTGTYGTANSLGDGGIPAPGETALGERIVRTLPDLAADRDAWAGRTVLLAGAGKSAQTAARALAELAGTASGTRLVWAVRSSAPDWGVVVDDPLPERQALVDTADRLAAGKEPAVDVRSGAVVEALSPVDGRIRVTLRTAAGRDDVVVDQILSLTGYVPDASIYRQLQVHECYATAAPIELSAALLGAEAGDCLTQESHGVDVLRSPEPNFFLLGAKSYGRNSQFLLRIGYEQVDEVAAAYAPAQEAAGHR